MELTPEILNYVVHCQNGKCPICSTDIQIYENEKICKNNCYYIRETTFGGYVVRTFGHFIASFSNNIPQELDYKLTVIKWINFWKKDDRYLVKILTGSIDKENEIFADDI